jgi:hypothetical protein
MHVLKKKQGIRSELYALLYAFTNHYRSARVLGEGGYESSLLASSVLSHEDGPPPPPPPPPPPEEEEETAVALLAPSLLPPPPPDEVSSMGMVPRETGPPSCRAGLPPPCATLGRRQAHGAQLRTLLGPTEPRVAKAETFPRVYPSPARK